MEDIGELNMATWNAQWMPSGSQVPNSLVYDAGGIQALAPQVVTVLMEVRRAKGECQSV